jgi:ABC-type glycerol-3-phosphate transport system substrate-binding protein
MSDARALQEKIEALPAERIAEVEDFVEFIASREQQRSLIRAVAAASAPAFEAIWGNPEDDAYDTI